MKKHIIYLLLVVLLGTACSDSNESDIKVLPDMNLVGRVMADGQPLAGVVMSDGFSVVATDDDGVYQIKLRKQSKFVFASIPADCEIPHKENIPVIYKKLGVRIVGEVLRRDFELKKAPKKDKFYLMALADVQIANSTDLTLLQGDIPKITSYVQSLNDKPMYGISLGDLVWDNMPYYKEYTEEIKKIGVPTFQVIGNHDHDINIVNDDAKSAKFFEEYYGPTYYSYNIGDCHFVVIDDVYFLGGPSKDYKGLITEEQLEWLKEDLKYVPKDKLIVLGTHIPTQRRITTTAVENRQELYDILEGYKVRILSGHTHNNYVTTITEDIEENTLGAVSGAFWTGDLCNDGSPRGFAIYEIDGNKISNWYYKGTHHERDYQMIIYSPGRDGITAARKDGIITNVFSWHTDWTINISENGGPFTTIPTNVKEMDPSAYDYMNGTNKPAIRPSVANPEKNNDHMFYYKPTTAWKNIKVEAKDPYGNVYESTLDRE